MATEIKSRRGTAAQHDDSTGFTGAEGELTVDTTNDTVRVHDGSTKGGHRLAKYTEVQASNELSEMLDVNLTSPADGSVLKYDNASSKWIDSSKLTETAAGIAVTGTVASSDGLTADYIDLTGGESTTTTGTIACKQIVLNDPTSTNDGDDGTDSARIYTEEGFGNQSKLVIHSADDGNDQIVLRTDNAVDVLVANASGIDVTGTVTADSLAVQPPSGDAAASLISTTGQSVLTVQSTFDGDESAEVAAIEIGAKSLAFIDFKAPSSDDYDLRIYHSDPANHSMVNSLTDDLFLRSGAKVALQHGGANTKLETTATGIDVTGTVTADGVSLGDADQIQIGDKVGGDLKIYHSGGHSFIEDVGTGNLVIRGQHVEIKDSSNKQKVYVADGASGAVQLYYGHDTSAKLTTTAAGIDVTGAITVSSTVDGRDIATDGTKLDAIESSADVTDTTNVVAALTAGTNVSIAGDGTISSTDTTYSVQDGELSQNSFTNDDHTKLNGIEASADVTDTTNVVAALTAGTNIAIAGNGTISSTNTEYTGGTGLTLDGTTFSVDVAQTQITSVGTLTSLTTGATTVNGSLSVNSTTSDTSYSPEIVLERNGGAAAGDDGDKLGVITFKGDNTSGTQSVYAQVGARIVDDGVDNANTKGEIRISCGYNANLVSLEDPSLRINHLGTWVNESTIDGTPVGASFYNVSKGTTSGIKYWANQSSGYAIEVKSVTPTADRDITFPDVSGAIVVAGVAGGSMNGGGGLGTAQTAWSPEQFATNANTDYYHYTPSGTDVDLVVAVPYAGIDISGFGSKFIFRNISAEAGSKITIDLDGFTSAISQGATQYYSINKYDGSAPTLITSAAANLVVSTGGVIELSPIANGVWNITGVGFA